MAKGAAQSAVIRSFVIANVIEHPRDIGQSVVEAFAISRQAVNRHLRFLVEKGVLATEGKTRNRTYTLRRLVDQEWEYLLGGNPEEHLAWEEDIAPLLSLPKNVMSILEFGFTEMFNNAVDHSQGTSLKVKLTRTAAETTILLHDNGIGIFKKIKEALHLQDERHAVLQLAKGKFTTDPTRHSGEGIFFTSRMFQPFTIWSGNVVFSHINRSPEDFVWRHIDPHFGTTVFMAIPNECTTTLVDVFGQFSSGDDKDFTRTVVPVRMAQYGTDRLISRSQAKRVVAGLDPFKCVVLDFQDVALIGQGFADEIFRVFRNAHPEIEVETINTVPDVQSMIDHVLHRAKR